MSRYLIDLAVTRRFARTLPLGTLAVNILGSLVFGIVFGLVEHGHATTVESALIGTGFCGGLTTASSAAFETARFAHQRRLGVAVATIALGVATSCAAAAVGIWIGTR